MFSDSLPYGRDNSIIGSKLASNGIMAAGMHWHEAEMPVGCSRKLLTVLPGDEQMRRSGRLPIQSQEKRIKEAISQHKVVAVPAVLLCFEDFSY